MDDDVAPNGTQDDAEDDLDADLGGGNANDLVRLALFSEQKRIPLRRDDINKRVLGSRSRTFNAVFHLAQSKLQNIFGMEMVELRSRAAANADGEEGEGNDVQATGVRKRGAATGSKTYILRSTLHPTIIEHASIADEKIIEEEIAALPDDDDEDDDDIVPRNNGSVIAWNSSDQLGAVGVLYVVLALILVNGRIMNDMDLRTQLKRLRLSSNNNDRIELTATSTHHDLPVDDFLRQCVRQGYLDKQKTGDAKSQGGKRGRPSQQQEDGSATYEWRWGPRAQSEVGERGIGQFVAAFMVERTRDGDEDEEQDEGAATQGRRKETQAKNKIEAVYKGIERAAGGTLSDVK
ncbi:MAGE-domain-containing protein [Punctularia strigosozonata HHB-11173 SS5]|uniref:MAGE-domain-containing protein n=1 Tax=Punctularia strigosozonata (strain HHB-11173) TaxID=741275 RepID=R7S4M7_PUNST|nr:MAGE-domain-containing protein [Punctularia strigosozonata HHB-11173 SS5]EIN04201.1 MAGE-domain-containing protein [Punctularia strigosozonata HHB-11173 SS5]